jgi:hypothetical protein
MFFSIASSGIPALGYLSLPQEIDPCKSIADEDICTAIQNSDGPKDAMFLPEVCCLLQSFLCEHMILLICLLPNFL